LNPAFLLRAVILSAHFNLTVDSTLRDNIRQNTTHLAKLSPQFIQRYISKPHCPVEPNTMQQALVNFGFTDIMNSIFPLPRVRSIEKYELERRHQIIEVYETKLKTALSNKCFLLRTICDAQTTAYAAFYGDTVLSALRGKAQLDTLSIYTNVPLHAVKERLSASILEAAHEIYPEISVIGGTVYQIITFHIPLAEHSQIKKQTVRVAYGAEKPMPKYTCYAFFINQDSQIENYDNSLVSQAKALTDIHNTLTPIPYPSTKPKSNLNPSSPHLFTNSATTEESVKPCRIFSSN